MTPVGALEIGPAGTRFVPIHSVWPWIGTALIGTAVGLLLAWRRR